MPSTLRHNFYVLISAMLVAISWVIAEIALHFYEVPVIWTAILTNLSGGLGLLLLAPQISRPSVWTFTWQQWVRLIIAAFCIYVASTLLAYYSINLIGAGKSTLLGLLQAPAVIILSIIFLGERLLLKHWLAGALMIFGAFLINFNPEALTFEFGSGELARVALAFFVGVGIVLMKPIVVNINEIQVTAVSMIISVFFLCAAIPWFDSGLQFSLPALGLLAIVGILRGLSWYFYYVPLPIIGASRAIILFGSYAFFTVMLQLIIVAITPNLGTQLPSNLAMALIGGVVIVVGIVVMTRSSD
ncbi:MAG: DMT family transporter [Chloroflexota bacterium]